jgi:hypothetical protein
MQEMGQALQQLTMEKHAKVLDIQSREKIAAAEIASKERIAAADRETKITVAELGAKVDRMQLFLDERERVGLQEDGRGHSSAAEHAHEIGMSNGARARAAGGCQWATSRRLEQGQAGVAGALVQQQQAADLAPQPEAGA